LSFKGVRAEVLLHALEDKDIYVSAGSACSTNRPHVSDTLKSIGLDTDLLDSTLRFSMSVFTNKDEIDHTINALEEIVPMLRRYSRQ
jgi:cysteine desulfurase